MVPGRPLRGLVQAAGVHDPEEALLLVWAGATAVGLPLRLDVHAQDCDEAQAARIAARLPPHVAVVCITYERDPRAMAELCRAVGAHAVQAHGPVEPEAMAELGRLDPGLYRVKSLVVGRDRDLEGDAARFAPHVDAFITDTFDPATGASGATGLVHDWRVSAGLARVSPRPVILAGGLNPDNVARAIEAVRPAGVDAHTGLEGPDGRKDPELARLFAERAAAAFAALA
jgi:phosphoribosylanthranilate isomerase